MSTGQQICKNIVKSKLLNIIDTIAPYRRIVISVCGRKTHQTESFALSDPDSGETVAENKKCAHIFAQTFQSQVERLVSLVGTRDSMTDKINKKFSTNPDE